MSDENAIPPSAPDITTPTETSGLNAPVGSTDPTVQAIIEATAATTDGIAEPLSLSTKEKPTDGPDDFTPHVRED